MSRTTQGMSLTYNGGLSYAPLQYGTGPKEFFQNIGKKLKVATATDDVLKRMGIANWIDKVSKGKYRNAMDGAISQGYGKKKKATTRKRKSTKTVKKRK